MQEQLSYKSQKMKRVLYQSQAYRLCLHGLVQLKCLSKVRGISIPSKKHIYTSKVLMCSGSNPALGIKDLPVWREACRRREEGGKRYRNGMGPGSGDRAHTNSRWTDAKRIRNELRSYKRQRDV